MDANELRARIKEIESSPRFLALQTKSRGDLESREFEILNMRVRAYRVQLEEIEGKSNVTMGPRGVLKGMPKQPALKNDHSSTLDTQPVPVVPVKNDPASPFAFRFARHAIKPLDGGVKPPTKVQGGARRGIAPPPQPAPEVRTSGIFNTLKIKARPNAPGFLKHDDREDIDEKNDDIDLEALSEGFHHLQAELHY